MSVSTIMPVFNAERYLQEALNSVLAQSYGDWECIIVDDGSTDSSRQIALGFCARDGRFVYLYQENCGPSAARNAGLRMAKGDYIQYLDSDDIILPDRFERMVNEGRTLTDEVILYSALVVGDKGDITDTKAFGFPMEIGKDVTFNDMYRGFGTDFLFVPSCLFFPRAAVIGSAWNEELIQSEDWDYYLNVLNNGYVFRFVPASLVVYRDTPRSLSKDLAKVYDSNYRVLSKWARRGSWLAFLNGTASVLKKSIILWLQAGADRVSVPPLEIGAVSVRVQALILLTYPLSVIYLSIETVKLLSKKLSWRRRT